MALLVLRHVDADDGLLVAVEVLRQRLGEFRLAHARRPQEDERPDRLVGVLEARPGAPHRLRHGPHRLVLVDEAAVQLLLHPQQPRLLLLGEFGDRDAGPARQDLGHVLARHHGLLLLLGLDALPLLLDAVQLGLQLQRPHVRFVRGLEVVARYGLLLLALQLVHLGLRGGEVRRDG